MLTASERWTRLFSGAVLAFLGWSCAPEAPAATPQEPAPSAAPAPRAQLSVAQRAEACAAAVESLAPDAEPGLAMRTVVEGCLAVYQEKGCRDGMERAISPGTDPSERMAIMSEACSAAYCPKLPEPKPAFCSAPRNQPLSERMPLYGAFRDAMLDYELGVDGKRRVIDAFAAASRRRKDAGE